MKYYAGALSKLRLDVEKSYKKAEKRQLKIQADSGTDDELWREYSEITGATSAYQEVIDLIDKALKGGSNL